MIHHVYANRSNAGDWLAATGIQSQLGDQSITEHFCDEPFVEDTILALSKCGPGDLVVIGGGGLFMDYFVPFWEGIQRLLPALRYGIWGVGYCDLKREPSRPSTKLLEEIVSQSQFCYVRDELSRNYLSDCQLPSPMLCPSMNAIRERSDGRGILHVDNYTTAGADVFAAMQLYAEQFAKNTDRAIRRTNNRLERASEKTLQATLDLYASCDIVLSSALHGCLIALAMGKKVLAVSGDWKIESSMAALGMADWVVDIKNVDDLPTRLHDLDTQPSPREAIECARRENRKIGAEVRNIASN